VDAGGLLFWPGKCGIGETGAKAGGRREQQARSSRCFFHERGRVITVRSDWLSILKNARRLTSGKNLIRVLVGKIRVRGLSLWGAVARIER